MDWIHSRYNQGLRKINKRQKDSISDEFDCLDRPLKSTCSKPYSRCCDRLFFETRRTDNSRRDRTPDGRRNPRAEPLLHEASESGEQAPSHHGGRVDPPGVFIRETGADSRPYVRGEVRRQVPWKSEGWYHNSRFDITSASSYRWCSFQKATKSV
jgi:hypothetical protein